MVLTSEIVQVKGGTVSGFIGHVSAFCVSRGLMLRVVELINFRSDLHDVVQKAGRCRLVLGKSLHRLLIANTFRFPGTGSNVAMPWLGAASTSTIASQPSMPRKTAMRYLMNFAKALCHIRDWSNSSEVVMRSGVL